METHYKLILKRIQMQYLFIYFALAISSVIVLHCWCSTLSMFVRASTHVIDACGLQ